VLRLLAPALLIVGIVVALRMNILERFIFFPEAALIGTPASLALPYEDVRFPADDGTMLHGWWVPGRRPETLLWFHGNAGNISHRLDNLRLLHDHVGINVLLFDYRQYGRSAGSVSEAGVYADARGARAYLLSRADVAADRIVYFGRSLGSAVAIDLAVTQSPRGLILETPFTSLRDMARQLLPRPLSAVLPRSFDSLDKIRAVGCPKLFLHGDQDEIIPYEQGRRLFAAAPPPKAFFTIRGAGHNDTYIVGGAPYFARITMFFDALASGAEG
jgi:fermentation-respiration switch protein FrsA (DUF1100 family)